MVRADTGPSLAASGTGFSLVFARPAGATAGICLAHFCIHRTLAAQANPPHRDRNDRSPFLRADAFTRETIVFERG